MANPGLATREASTPKAAPARMPALKACAPSAAHALPSFLSSAGNMAIQRVVADPSQGRSGTVLLQRKLTIGSVDDPLEHEADRVAEQVMRMPAAREPIGSSAPQVQRKCACGGTCDSCRSDEEQRRVQRKSAARPQIAAGASAATTRMNAPPIVHEVLRSPGQPLPSSVRTFFEPRFGADFSQVRVHTDAAAQQSAHAMNANAYTVGRSIVFGTGRFAPETQEGQRLLAHELTHVGQQSAQSSAGIVQRQMCTDILDADEVPGVTRGVEVESAVRVDLIDRLGAQNIVWPLTIPGASSRDYRDEACGGFQSTRPPRSGYPDLAFRQHPRGRTLELAEVKIGTWPCLYLAEEQVDKYVKLADENEAYKRHLGVDHVEVMPTSRLTPTQLRDPVSGTAIDVGWCSPGVIVYKAVAEPEEEEEPEEKEPKDKEPKDQGPDPSVPLRERLMELGAKLAKLLAADGALSAALSFVGRFALMLTPFMALAALAFGIVYFWDEIKWVAGMIAGVAKRIWDTVSSVAGKIKDAIKELGIKFAELAVFVGGLIKDVVEAIAEGLLRAGRAVISGAKWLGGRIAEGAEAVWDWLFGSDVEPTIPKIELPITEEPTMRCGTVAREDALIRIESDLLFPFGKYKLTDMDKDKAEPVLEDAAAKVLATPRVSDTPVRFMGFTDVIGDPGDNQTLSEQRAGAVADWFVEKGVIPRSPVEIRGFGETEARAKADDEKGREKDRRVDILVTKKGSAEKVCW